VTELEALMSPAADCTLFTEKGSRITRDSRYKVGKRMGRVIYIHKNYMSDVVPEKTLKAALLCLPHGFRFEVVKYDLSNQCLSFISSSDWNEADEPTVGEAYRVRRGGHLKRIPPSGKIYHHKWLFVKGDYEGFNVEESFERSRRWLALSNVDMSRIGSAEFWNTHVVPRLCSKVG